MVKKKKYLFIGQPFLDSSKQFVGKSVLQNYEQLLEMLENSFHTIVVNELRCPGIDGGIQFFWLGRKK